MIISKKALQRIKDVIDNNYKSLLVTTLGTKTLSEAEIARLKDAGFNAEDKDSLLSLIYYNSVLNDLGTTMGPISIEEMQRQQKAKPKGTLFTTAEEHLNENLAQLIEQLKAKVQAGIEGTIRDYNLAYRNDALQNLTRPEEMDKLVMESTVGGLKRALRDYSGDVLKDWRRIAVTETANAIGLGSVDRVVTQNKDKDLEEIYVFRIPVNDAALCSFCRKFYLDADQSPAVYRLSTLLSNGTNYGKKKHDWKPVATVTHANDRETGIIELKPGWKVLPEGKMEFIGKDVWQEYIQKKLR